MPCPSEGDTRTWKNECQRMEEILLQHLLPSCNAIKGRTRLRICLFLSRVACSFSINVLLHTFFVDVGQIRGAMEHQGLWAQCSSAQSGASMPRTTFGNRRHGAFTPVSRQTHASILIFNLFGTIPSKLLMVSSSMQLRLGLRRATEKASAINPLYKNSIRRMTVSFLVAP